MIKSYIIPLMMIAIAILIAACAPAPTATPVPTAVPPTTAPQPTAVPPTATTAPAPTSAPTVAPPTATTAPTAVPGVSAAAVEKIINDTFSKVDRSLALWNIQPGLGTVMVEYGNRFSRLWFAANAANWDMAKYQLDEMTEIQEVGETTRPGRAPMLKAFEDGFLAPIDKAILAKDKTAFTTAFNNAVNGCNACHAASTGAAATPGYNWKSYSYVKVQVPKNDPAPYVDWKGGGQDSYITSIVAPTATPKPALTGTLDAGGVKKLITDKFNVVDRNIALGAIQPGLGTVMIEYADRYSRLYYAAKAGNWDMAKYQLDEMTEIQEVGETTRPGRAPMLKAFEDGFLAPLDKAIQAKDSKAFDDAYAKATDGCNGCHVASTGGAATPGYQWKSYKYVKIQPPTADTSSYIAWKANQLTGSYITTTIAPTATPKPAASGSIDLPAAQKMFSDTMNTVDRSLALWNIQPGLGTVMIEYAKRYAQLKYALDNGNWDMAKYQLDEMTEIQEVGETTRPGRAPMLKAFEDAFLKPMDDAILAKDKAKADTAYKNMTNGCNGCHVASTGAAATPGYQWKSYGWVMIQPPTTDPADYLSWNAGTGNTGNYVPATSSSTSSATTSSTSSTTSSTGSSSSTSSSSTASSSKASSSVGGPPAIPVNHVGRTQCLICHSTGVGGAPTPVPTIHSALPDDPKICMGCHQQAK